MRHQVIPGADISVAVRDGFEIVSGRLLPVDNKEFPGGQVSIRMKSASGRETMGFGFTWQAATDDAYDSGIVPYVPKHDAPKALLH